MNFKRVEERIMATKWIVCAVLGFGVVSALPVSAASSCTSKDVQGYRGFVCEGYASLAPGAPQLPVRILGTCVATDAGDFSRDGAANLSGTVLPIHLEGPGMIEPDCTGRITYRQTIAGQPAPDVTVALVVFDRGDAIKSMSLSSTGVLACVSERISQRQP
jgi:hypothetical protein